MLKFFTIFILLPFFISCSSSSEENFPAQDNTNTQNHLYYIPEPLTSFSIVLGEKIPETFDTKAIDLDAFSTTKDEISILHKEGKKVFAYVSVGSWEPYRKDSNDFPKEIIGNVYPGWEDEKFLNIKAIDQLTPIIKKRFDMIMQKGFDGIEADNIDIYTVDDEGANGTGFHISLSNIKEYVDFLIREAHSRNLSIGQKNAPEFTQKYGDLFDWAILEDPFYEKYAPQFKIYTEHQKAVFSISYLDNTDKTTFVQTICQEAAQLSFTAILKERDLTDIETRCP